MPSPPSSDQALTTGAHHASPPITPVFRSYLHVGDLTRLVLAALDAGRG